MQVSHLEFKQTKSTLHGEVHLWPYAKYSYNVIIQNYSQTSVAMHVKCNTQTRSRNRCYRGRATSVILIVCVCSLRFPACKAHALLYIVICALYDSTIFFDIIS